MTTSSEIQTEAGGPIRVLLIEDDRADADLVRTALAAAGDQAFAVEWVDRLVPALDLLAEGGIDLCLVDLTLPDSQGPRTVLATRAQAPDVPIIVLAASEEDATAVQAAADGAHDYVVKAQLDPELLAWSIRHAIQAHRTPAPPVASAAIDPLTDLLNARGLHAVGERQARIAWLGRRPFAVLYLDVDGLGRVNEAEGRGSGDRALVDVAGILTGTFRNSDVIARAGGDEFCVILAEVAPEGPGEQRARDRLRRRIDAFNLRHSALHPLSLTVGSAYFDPASPCSFAELVGRAERAMLAHKQKAA
jgi:diguanylate cyclase (GGDEF)-like protein